MSTPLNEPAKTDTKLVKEPSKLKMIKVKLKLPQYIDGTMKQPGEVVEVDEVRATQLLRVSEGQYSFAGERSESDTERHKIQLAERI